MPRVVIREGEARPGLCGGRLAWYGLQGAPNCRARLQFLEVPGGAWGKLFGLCSWRWFWPWQVSHGDSDRIIWIRSGEGLTLRTYSYREGGGPATSGKPAWVEDAVLARITPYTQPFEIAMHRTDEKTLYQCVSLGKLEGEHVVERRQPLRWPSVRTFAHCDNGPSNPVAPGRIAFNFEALS